jgi:hypothetical protein
MGSPVFNRVYKFVRTKSSIDASFASILLQTSAQVEYFMGIKLTIQALYWGTGTM